jgi:hypothetical protein
MNGLDFIFRRVTPAENQGHREVFGLVDWMRLVR